MEDGHLHSLLVEAGAKAEVDAVPGRVNTAGRIKVERACVLFSYPKIGLDLALPRGSASKAGLWDEAFLFPTSSTYRLTVQELKTCM